MGRIPYHLIGGGLTIRRADDTSVNSGGQQALGSNTLLVASLAQLVTANNEQADNLAVESPVTAGLGNSDEPLYAAIVTLPEPHSLSGVHVAWNCDMVYSGGTQFDNEVWYRTVSGVWTKGYEAAGHSTPTGWNTPTAVAWSNVVAVAATLMADYQATVVELVQFHLHGEPTTPATLQLWHPTLDEPLGDVDFGVMSASSESVVPFRLKNLNHRDATTITVSASYPTGDLASEITFSDDDVTYGATTSVAALATGATSGVLYAKRTTGVSPTLGSQVALVSADAASWS